MTTANGATWYWVHVEDDVDILRQVKEYLEGEDFEFGHVRVAGTSEIDDALTLLRERRVDLLINPRRIPRRSRKPRYGRRGC